MSRTYLDSVSWVTVKNAYFVIIDKVENGKITYKDDVYEAMTIKQIGVSPKNATLDIYASGALLNTLSKNQGADITVDSVALPNWLISMLQGSKQHKGGVIESTKDYPVGFAFGYQIETSDGGYHAAWCPNCKLQPPNRTTQTSADNLTEPKETYNIKCMPTVKGDIDFEYNTTDAKEAGYEPLDEDDFFAKPISTKEEFETLLDTAVAITPAP